MSNIRTRSPITFAAACVKISPLYGHFMVFPHFFEIFENREKNKIWSGDIFIWTWFFESEFSSHSWYCIFDCMSYTHWKYLLFIKKMFIKLRRSVPTWRPRLPIDEFDVVSSDVRIISGLGIFTPEMLTSWFSSSVTDASDDSNDWSRESSSEWTISGITSGSLKIAALGFLLNSGISELALVSELSSITGDGILCAFEERMKPTRVSNCVDRRRSVLLFAAFIAPRQSDRIYRRSLWLKVWNGEFYGNHGRSTWQKSLGWKPSRIFLAVDGTIFQIFSSLSFLFHSRDREPWKIQDNFAIEKRTWDRQGSAEKLILGARALSETESSLQQRRKVEKTRKAARSDRFYQLLLPHLCHKFHPECIAVG